MPMTKLEKLDIENSACIHELNRLASEDLSKPIGAVRNGRLKVIDAQRKVCETNKEMLMQGIIIEVEQNIEAVRALIFEMDLLKDMCPPPNPTSEEIAHADTDRPPEVEVMPASEKRRI